jgi:hypothetical protein
MLRLITIGDFVRVALVMLMIRWQYASPSLVGNMSLNLLSEAELDFWMGRDVVYIWINVALR